MSPPREIELKLDIDPRDIADLRTNILPRLGAVAQGTSRLLSVYFDTRKQALRTSGLSLRVRVDGGRFVQTLKAEIEPGIGLVSRGEWESEVAGQEPDPAAAASTPLAAVLARKRGARRLSPVFETSIERTRWLIEAETHAIEVALDEGQVRAGSVSAPIVELELELKHGAPAHLFETAKEIARALPVKLGVRSTAERGYALLEPAQSTSSKATPVALTTAMSTAAAFQAIMRTCVRQFRQNEPLVIERRGAEPLHQARVAIRRLRSALSLFEPCVADDSYAQIANRLRVLSGKLGAARNLDVYLECCEDHAAEDGPGSLGAAQLADEIEARREEAYADLVRSLESPAGRALMLDLVAWVETGAWLTAADPEQAAARDGSIADFAVDVLERRRRKLRKTVRHLERLSPRERHRVRIRAKKLRYASEFFAGLVGSRKGRRRHAAFLGAVQDLQDSLGDLNDIETGQALAAAIVRDLAYRPRPHVRELVFTAGHVSGRQAASGRKLLRRARRAARRFAETPRFWAR